MSFRNVSLHLTESLSKDTKQAEGIFFTPKEARDVVFRLLSKHSVKPESILEPSFGSGEFLEDAYERFPNAKITGVELNPVLFRATNRPNTFNQDFLTYTGSHDLILGNPPYFVIPKSSETLKCQIGRPNIFVQFLYKAVRENLTSKGYLAFVLPTSFFNCAYYELTRRYLFETTTVLEVEVLPGKYIDTAQQTFVLLLRKMKQTSDYFLQLNNSVYLTPHYREIGTLRTGSKTLAELGFEVKTGDVVWNQEKDKLADSGTLLVYSSNFSKGVLEFKPMKDPKKQYIQGLERPCLSGKTILINRGYGNTSYKLTAVLVDLPAYYAENHVNVIKPKTPEAIATIELVYKSLRDPRTAQFITFFVGNGALSKTEIENCLPIWTD